MTIRDAATVVLVRDNFEIFFLKRAAGHAFMANRWVFPGGRLDDRDRDRALRDHVDDPALLEGTLGALRVTALRETFEETGLLLAKHPTTGLPFTGDAPELRAAVDDGHLGLARVCQDLALRLTLSELHFFAHWITPDFEPRRYDTRFFLARVPTTTSDTAESASDETTAGAWLTPQEALQRYHHGGLLLAPPTIATLEDLARFDAVTDAVQAARDARPDPLLPHLLGDARDPTLLLPGDPDYPAEASVQPPWQSRRMVLQDNRWRSQRRRG